MKSKLPIAGLAIACAACCTPLLIPLLAGTGLAACFAELSLDSVVCGVIAIAALGMAAYWLVARWRTKAQSECGCATSCDPASGCDQADDRAVRG
ncbi:MAG: hypothetical protein H6916_04510 [Novosphingobium sp.]|nr:hypothetical protein [Novosphingobium sp.]MCP5386066.1 hypothetical protein [Novosphingobium sp.]